MKQLMSDDFHSSHPWLSIWTKPRETIRAIIEVNPKRSFLILSWFYGFPIVLQLFQNAVLGSTFSLLFILGLGFLLAPIVGMLLSVMFTAILLWTGKWMGGAASFYEIRAAFSWSNVPYAVSSFIWLINSCVFTNRLFSPTLSQGALVGYELPLLTSASLIQMVLAIWSFVIWVRALSEVQQFSIWKSLLNIFLSALCVTALIGVVLGFSMILGF